MEEIKKKEFIWLLSYTVWVSKNFETFQDQKFILRNANARFLLFNNLEEEISLQISLN